MSSCLTRQSDGDDGRKYREDQRLKDEWVTTTDVERCLTGEMLYNERRETLRRWQVVWQREVACECRRECVGDDMLLEYCESLEVQRRC